MSWLEIFVLTAKWITAIWCGALAAALVGFGVLAAITFLGGLVTGAEPLLAKTDPNADAGSHLAA